MSHPSTGFRIDPTVRKMIRIRAAELDISMSDYIAGLVLADAQNRDENAPENYIKENTNSE
jgi:hypothetical protein